MIVKRIYNTILISKYYSYKNYTILCPNTWHRFKSGKINGKSDLKKLDDQYYKKKKNNMPFYSATYTYIEDNLSRNVNNIEELMDLLFN